MSENNGKRKRTDDHSTLQNPSKRRVINIKKLCKTLLKSVHMDEVNQFRHAMNSHIECRFPLQVATSLGLHNVVKQLLIMGYDPNERNTTGVTPLHIACEFAEVTCAEQLLSCGSDVRSKDSEGKEPFDILFINMKRSINGYQYFLRYSNFTRNVITGENIKQVQAALFSILKLMFKYGYTINFSAISCFGMVRIMITCCPREIVDLLIDNGLDIQAMDNRHGGRLLHSVVSKDVKDNVQELLKYIDVNHRTEYDDETPLHNASECGSVSCIDVLLESGADIDAISGNGFSPLEMALSGRADNTDKCVELLLQRNCKITDTTMTIMHNLKVDRPVDTTNTISEMKRLSVYRHVLKRLAADLNVNNLSKSSIVENLRDVTDINYVKFLCVHRSEIGKMKGRMLAPYLTAYDIIREDSHYLAHFVDNRFVKQFFDTNSYAAEFPLYADYLETSYKMACIRKPFIYNVESV